MSGTVNPQLPLPPPTDPSPPSIVQTFTQWANSLVTQLFSFGQRINLCLPKDGSEAMTGALTTKGITDTATVTLAADPTTALQAATKQYVDGKVPTVAYFEGYKAANFAPTSAVWTKVVFDNVPLDNKSWWDATNHRYTPKLAGKYKVTWIVSVNNTSFDTQAAFAAVYKNGGQYKASTWNWTGTTYLPGQFSMTVVTTVPMNGTTDYLEGYVYLQSPSGAAVVQTGGGAWTYMNAEYIGP